MCCICTLAVIVLFPSFSSCTSPLFFFPGTTLYRGISGSKCPALGLAFTKAFSFSYASTGLHTLFLFFPAQHYIGRSLDPNVQHWDLHSLGPFHFPALLLDYTHFVFFFWHNTTLGDLWIQMITTGRCIQLGQVFISLGFFWTAHNANLVFFKTQHYIGRSLDPNDHMWDTHSLRIFHFHALLLDCTQSRFQRIVQK